MTTKERFKFWRWLYNGIKAIFTDEEFRPVIATVSGVLFLSFGIAFGITITPYALVGIPVGLLMILYGFYLDI